MNEEEALISNYIYKKVELNPEVESQQGSAKFVDKDFEPGSNNLREVDDGDFQWMEIEKVTSGELFKELGYSPFD